MSGGGAKRQAQEAAQRSDIAAAELREQTKLLKDRSDRERERSGRLLMRSIRAGGGGFYETAASERSTPALTGQPKRAGGGGIGGVLQRAASQASAGSGGGTIRDIFTRIAGQG